MDHSAEIARFEDATDLCHQAERTFPLRLTPFEHYLLADALAGNDMTFLLHLHVEGIVHRERFEAAVRYATLRHPMCRATVKRSRWRNWHWHFNSSLWPGIYWNEPTESFVEPLDVCREPGVRVRVEQNEHDAKLIFQFHHSCCDGVGAFQWLGDVLAAYGILHGNVAEFCVEDVDIGRLADRGRTRTESFPGLRWWSEHLREIYKFWCQRPRPLSVTRRSEPDSTTLFEPSALITHAFSFEETCRLRRQATQQNVSLNDLLLRDLFITLVDWNSTSPAPGNPWYRINMPTSLRDKADAVTPAANLMSMTFLNRRHGDIVGDKQKLLAGIQAESEEIRRDARGALLLEALAVGVAVPGTFPIALRLPVCMSTAVLTNVGDPSRRFTARLPRQDGLLVAGNLRVKLMGGVPPLRRQTHAAIGVTTYNGQMLLSLMMTPRRFSQDDARRFLDRYIHHIQASLPPG